MRFIDMHCDSLSMLYFCDPEKAELFDSQYVSVDFNRMKIGGQMAQFFAVFLEPDETFEMLGIEKIPVEEYILKLRGYLLKNIETYSDIISFACNAEEIENNWKAGKVSAVLTMEDGRAVNGKLENLQRYYDMGFRALSLTWNQQNCFGAPNSKDIEVMKTGLTDFGKEAVIYMQELGMMVDVSHLSEGGFYDVAEICKKPFVATHSNCISICPHQRNLTDEQVKILGNKGGVAGINFGPEFLNENVKCKDSTVEKIVKHIRHMADIGGIECVGLGSDFDGIEGNLEISDCSKFYILEEKLREEGFTESDIEKIFYKNILRVMKDSIK